MIGPAAEAGNGGRERGYTQARLEAIAEDVTEIKQTVRGLADWQRGVDARLAQMEERHSRQAGWNLIYTTVAAAIAGFVGTRNTP